MLGAARGPLPRDSRATCATPWPWLQRGRLVWARRAGRAARSQGGGKGKLPSRSQALDVSPRATRAGRRASGHRHPKPACSCPRSGAALPSAPVRFYPSGLRSKLRGVFLDGAGDFALRPRGKPRRFVSPVFRTGAGEEGGGRAGCRRRALGQRRPPARPAGPSGKGLCSRGATPPEAAAALLAVCQPTSGRWPLRRPQEKEKDFFRRGSRGTLTIARTGSEGGQRPVWLRRGAELWLRDRRGAAALTGGGRGGVSPAVAARNS
ncbi:uncharacterized protein LOC131575939 [Poecile atricapillus]|uniref:uncharacterized protein LOC131575939 n=1 Tax=Poecile atricapillus TaxID=48891 RepID=UPI002739A4E0|nr:uncharacterized protein LOC131575939 [Poecile atricapillus]